MEWWIFPPLHDFLSPQLTVEAMWSWAGLLYAQCKNGEKINHPLTTEY